MRGRRRFRESVRLDDAASRDLVERAPHLVRKGRSARDAGADRAQVVLRELGVAQDRDVHRRHAREDRRPAFWISRRMAPISRGSGCRMTSLPRNVAESKTVRPYTWNSGTATSTRSGTPRSGTQRAVCIAFATRLRWVSIAPFGVPVVPPVYWRTATSSSAADDSLPGGVAARSAKRCTHGSDGMINGHWPAFFRSFRFLRG